MSSGLFAEQLRERFGDGLARCEATAGRVNQVTAEVDHRAAAGRS